MPENERTYKEISSPARDNRRKVAGQAQASSRTGLVNARVARQRALDADCGKLDNQFDPPWLHGLAH